MYWCLKLTLVAVLGDLLLVPILVSCIKGGGGGGGGKSRVACLVIGAIGALGAGVLLRRWGGEVRQDCRKVCCLPMLGMVRLWYASYCGQLCEDWGKFTYISCLQFQEYRMAVSFYLASASFSCKPTNKYQGESLHRSRQHLLNVFSSFICEKV